MSPWGSSSYKLLTDVTHKICGEKVAPRQHAGRSVGEESSVLTIVVDEVITVNLTVVSDQPLH